MKLKITFSIWTKKENILFWKKARL